MTTSRPLAFWTIDLSRDAETAVAFRRDSYVCSFGSDEAFGAPERYLEWLADRIAKEPAGHVHVWKEGVIIGQMEMHIRPGSPNVGYINLFYLTPDARGSGDGDALHEYAVSFMREHSVERVLLSVSPMNARAIGYYRKHGWRDCGAHPDDRSVSMMELMMSGQSSGRRPDKP
jgi:GNAT superfamily N-acetyltransferase